MFKCHARRTYGQQFVEMLTGLLLFSGSVEHFDGFDRLKHVEPLEILREEHKMVLTGKDPPYRTFHAGLSSVTVNHPC